jgi:hypothetical protein
MRISFTDEIEGGRILYPIGRVRAASPWHASGAPCTHGDWKDAALRALIEKAQDIEADAIIGVDYETDGAAHNDLGQLELERIAATGIAVKLARR